MEALPGATIGGGRYALCGEIASGGMATVHLARQIGAGGFARIVAVKRLHERYARDPEFIAMFLDEARLVARVRHPNVVQTLDVVVEGSELFIVMDYVHGESLLRLTAKASKAGATGSSHPHADVGHLPVSITAAIFAGALHGLHEAHEARSEAGEPLGVVHRDVSPHNILVGADGVARVLDFGVAKASQRIQTTQQGQLKGKLSYMAPEQLMDRPVDRRTDVYAAAVCLWEALAGTKLFGGSNEASILNQILLDPVRRPSALNPRVPASLEAVALRGLARDPAGRFASAHEMALAIENASPLATTAEVGALVSQLCARSMAQRSSLIAAAEMRGSSSAMREAVDSLRSMTSRNLPVARPIETMPPPPLRASESPAYAAWGGTVPPPADLVRTTGDDLHAAADSARRMPAHPISSRTTPSVAPPNAARTGAAIAMALLMVVATLGLAGYLLVVKKHANARTLAPTLVEKEAGVLASSSAGDSPAEHASAAPMPSATCPDGMALVPGGRFFMGSDEDLPAEKPAHKVIMRAYCMDKYEVTADAYRACSNRGDCKRAGTTNKWDGITAKDSKVYDPLCTGMDPARGKHPVNCVDWPAADRFCRAEGKRLPTEAEWEFAARGSDGRKYPWGDAPPSAKHLNACGGECLAWGKKHGAPLEALFIESDPFATTAPVGSFPDGVSRWGIEDLVGNVWEWTADVYAAYTDEDVTDPTGPAAGTTRVMRGGAWNGAYADWVRPSFRFHDAETTRSHGVGFRCASLPAGREQ